jgi:hypothetical protein
MQGYISESKDSKELVEQAQYEADPVKAWLTDCTKPEDGYKTKRDDLYISFCKYCRIEARDVVAKRDFYYSLRNKGYRLLKSNGTWYFSDIRAILG